MADETPEPPPQRSAPLDGARGYGATLLIGLASAGAVAVAVSKPWLSADFETPGLPTISASVSGAELAPLAGALGLVLLAGFGAVIATRGWVRRAVGLVTVVAAIVVLVSAINADAHDPALADALSQKGWSGSIDDVTTRSPAWRWIALAAAVTCGLAAAAVVRYGARWPVMGTRYDAPQRSDSVPAAGDGAAGDLDEREIWKALDEGRDPTAER